MTHYTRSERTRAIRETVFDGAAQLGRGQSASGVPGRGRAANPGAAGPVRAEGGGAEAAVARSQPAGGRRARAVASANRAVLLGASRGASGRRPQVGGAGVRTAGFAALAQRGGRRRCGRPTVARSPRLGALLAHAHGTRPRSHSFDVAGAERGRGVRVPLLAELPGDPASGGRAVLV